MYFQIKKAAYDGLIASELAVERALDLVLPHEKNFSGLDDMLTILVKTFMRPRLILRLIASIHRFYPGLPMIVVDDSPDAKPIPGVNSIILPYDTGLTIGRREGLRQVETKYVLMADDDFLFYRHTRLGEVVALLEQHPVIDILGGAVVNLPYFTVDDFSTARLYQTQSKSNFPQGTLIGGLPAQDKIANFFVARTDRLRLVQWDTNLRLVDHRDFFTRARGVLTTVYNRNFRCLHAPTPFDKLYMERRNDNHKDLEYLGKKYADG